MKLIFNPYGKIVVYIWENNNWILSQFFPTKSSCTMFIRTKIRNISLNLYDFNQPIRIIDASKNLMLFEGPVKDYQGLGKT